MCDTRDKFSLSSWFWALLVHLVILYRPSIRNNPLLPSNCVNEINRATPCLLPLHLTQCYIKSVIFVHALRSVAFRTNQSPTFHITHLLFSISFPLLHHNAILCSAKLQSSTRISQFSLCCSISIPATRFTYHMQSPYH